MLRLILSALILAASLVSLSGCESLNLITAGSTTPSTELIEPVVTPSAPDTSEVAPVELPQTNDTPEPIPAVPEEPKKPKVTLLNPDNYEQAKAQHLQALIQSHIEPLAMADVGYYMDVQNAQFIKLLGPTSFDIRHEAGLIILTMPGVDIFGQDSDQIDSAAKDSLALTSRVLVEFAQTQIVIYGHTDDTDDIDDTGGAEHNQKHSVQRALAVADHLLTQGIAIERIAVVGLGETSPLSLDTTEAGRARNSRIELHLKPIAK